MSNTEIIVAFINIYLLIVNAKGMWTNRQQWKVLLQLRALNDKHHAMNAEQSATNLEAAKVNASNAQQNHAMGQVLQQLQRMSMRTK